MIKVCDLTKIYTVPKKEFKKNIKNIFSPPKEFIYGLKNINFTIDKGEFIGLVGLNGAGKTTLIKILSGILTPTSGTVNVNGYTPYLHRKKYTEHISLIMGQKSVLFYDLAVIESLRFYKDVYELNNAEFADKIELFSDYLGLDKLIHIPVRKLSLGQKMKCEIAASLLHNPDVVFLDEPTLGLDIISKKAILELISNLNKDNKITVILTTHDIEDISDLCKRIIVLNKGEIEHDGSSLELKERNEYKSVEIIYRGNLHIQDLDYVISEKMVDSEGEGKRIVLKVKTEKLFEVLNELNKCERNIIDLNINTVRLRDILFDIYKDQG